MAIRLPEEESPRKRLRLSISHHNQRPVYEEFQTRAYIAQLPAHAQFHTQNYIPPQFHYQHDIPTCASTHLERPPQIPTPPDTPPTLYDSQFSAPSHAHYYAHIIPQSQLSPPLQSDSINGFCEEKHACRETKEENERDEVRNKVLRDVQKAFGGEQNFAKYLATGSRSSRVLRWEVDRLSMGG